MRTRIGRSQIVGGRARHGARPSACWRRSPCAPTAREMIAAAARAAPISSARRSSAAPSDYMLENRREHLQPADRDDRPRAAASSACASSTRRGGSSSPPTRARSGRVVDKQAESCFACHAQDRPLEKPADARRARASSRREPGTASSASSIRSRISPPARAPPATPTAPSETVLGVLDVTVSLDDVDRQIAASRTRIVALAIGCHRRGRPAALVAQPAARQPPGRGPHRGHAARRGR